MLYAPEHFTDDEAAVLKPYFSNLDGPVFALVNLPEVVKGALIAVAVLLSLLNFFTFADELGDLGPGGPALGGEDRGPRRRRRG